MPYPGQSYPGQYYPSQTAGPDQRLGTDSGLLVESTSLVVWSSTSDTANTVEVRTGTTSATRSDTSALNDQSSNVASNTSSDIASLSESNSIFQGLLKDTTDLATFTENASLFVTQTRSDTASGLDIQQEASSFYKADLYTVIDNITQQNILSSDSLTLTEFIPPRFDYLSTQDSFGLLDLGFSNRPVIDSDLFEFAEQANVFEKTRITYDPIQYPQSYYGSTRTRIIAQDHFTREFIHWDLPVDGLELTFALSGPNLFKGTLSTEMESILTLKQKLEPYRTWLHVEDDGYIIASFILTPFIDNPQEQSRGIEGEGFSSYPHSVYWEDNQYIGVQVDPADMIRKLWDHVQSYPDGNLYAKVWSTTTPVRIGYPTNSVQFTSKEGNEVSIQGEPYNLNFWSVINCGEEINRLCQETPIEYWEFSIWNEFKNDVEHYIVLGYPRVGSKRQDLVFREGENLVQLVPSYQEAQENYASDVFVIGAGQGPGAVRVKHSERIGRLRRTHVIQDQQISNKERAQAIADFEFKRLSKSRYLIENITVDTTHTNARWGSFIAGDDIYLQCTVPYVGFVQAWYRITEYVYDPYQRIATLTLAPSDSFTYGATNYNPYADIPHEGFAVLSDADFDISDQSDEDSIRQLNIKLCQQNGVENFNKNNVKNGFAYAYWNSTGTTYQTLLMPINQVIDPYFIIIGRTQDGYLITGENVYLVASDGSIGQPPDTQNETANPTAPPAGTWSPIAQAPFPVGLQLAAREYYNAFTSNMYISPELSYMGISANAESWRSTVGYLYYTVYGKQYNYQIKSPGGDFAFMVSNISRNVGFMV